MEHAARPDPGMERVPAPARECWFCGEPAVCGQKPPGRRRRRAQALCARHADAVFGPDDPPWARIDAKTGRDLVNEWMRALTIVSHGRGRRPAELLAEIAGVTQPETIQVRLVTPLLPGEKWMLDETQRAVTRLRSRETSVHMMITSVLVGWLAEATGQTRSDVLQRLSLTLDSALPPDDPPPGYRRLPRIRHPCMIACPGPLRVPARSSGTPSRDAIR